MEVAVHITPQDIAEGEDLDFEEKEEHWNIYKLSDGTTLKVKLLALYFGLGIPLLLFEIALIMWWEWD